MGLFPVSLSLPGYHTKMTDICLVIARCLVAFYWKNIEAPSTDHCLKDLAHYITKKNYSIKGKLKDYHKIWDLFSCDQPNIGTGNKYLSLYWLICVYVYEFLDALGAGSGELK